MTIKVTSCHDCPLCNHDNEYGDSCNYPNNEVEEEDMPNPWDNCVPTKCPLLKENITIELQTT